MTTNRTDTSFMILAVTILALFWGGYVVGSDVAHRDNAVDSLSQKP